MMFDVGSEAAKKSEACMQINLCDQALKCV